MRPEHIEAQVEDERQAGDARARDAEDRDLAGRDLDDHGEIEADQAACWTERQPRQLQRRADQVRAAVEREQTIGGDDQRQWRGGRTDRKQDVAGGAGAYRSLAALRRRRAG